MDSGDFDDAVLKFAFAEDILLGQNSGPQVKEWFQKTFTFVTETVTGNEELGPYYGEGFERVLMLNYKSVAYLLQGDRKAYNVTRRAIDWQNIEREAFEEKLREIQDDLEESQQKGEESEGGLDALPDAEGGAFTEVNGNTDTSSTPDGVRSILSGQYSEMDAKALTVPSAYVNPFGYYVAGMIQEFESYDDISLRDNARISYQKALELNPESPVIQEAVDDLKKWSPEPGTRLIHVVAAAGFVPEKKMLFFGFPVGDIFVPVKLPIYEPVPQRIKRIEVFTTKGKRLARLSPIADVEAICLRHQKDMEPFRILRVMLAVGSSYVEKQLWAKLGDIGRAIGELRDQMKAPDTRSWMSLPATVQAARLHAPRNLKQIKIVTFDGKGKKLATKTIALDTATNNFVYARCMNNILYAYPNKKLWICKN